MPSMLCLGPGALLSDRLLALALAMALLPSVDWAVQIRIIQNSQLVYNETISPLKAGISGIHVAAVDRERLPGDEIAFRRRQENQRAQQVLGMLVAPQRTRLHGALARGLDVTGILAHHRVAQGEARRQRIDADAVLAKLARERARERHDAALAGDVVQHPRDAAKGGAGTDIDDLAITLRDHVGADVLDHQKRPAQIDR